MDASNTPAPAGEYARTCETVVDLNLCARSGDPIARDLLACERALEAARAERDALKAENARLSGEVDQSLIAQAFSERDAARAALERIYRAWYPERVVVETLPAGYGVDDSEVGKPGPWYGVRVNGETRGWSRNPDWEMCVLDVGFPEPSAGELARIAAAALRSAQEAERG